MNLSNKATNLKPGAESASRRRVVLTAPPCVGFSLENTMNKVTIIKATGTGILTKAADGKWDISINGQQGGSLHYTQDQVDKIITAARAKGETVVEV